MPLVCFCYTVEVVTFLYRVVLITHNLIAVCPPVQPIHWIYSKEAMKTVVAQTQGRPEFLPVSANPYYTLPTGSQSPYGDQLLVMLESLVQCSGELENGFPPGTTCVSISILCLCQDSMLA